MEAVTVGVAKRQRLHKALMTWEICLRQQRPGQAEVEGREPEGKISSVQDGICAWESQCVHSIPSLRRFPKVAMETRNGSNV